MNKKPGRKPGFVVSDESKLQARNSNPYKVRVKTALGEFLGYEDAATAHGITPSLIKHRCQKGAHQREIGKLRDIESNRGKQHLIAVNTFHTHIRKSSDQLRPRTESF